MYKLIVILIAVFISSCVNVKNKSVFEPLNTRQLITIDKKYPEFDKLYMLKDSILELHSLNYFHHFRDLTYGDFMIFSKELLENNKLDFYMDCLELDFMRDSLACNTKISQEKIKFIRQYISKDINGMVNFTLDTYRMINDSLFMVFDVNINQSADSTRMKHFLRHLTYRIDTYRETMVNMSEEDEIIDTVVRYEGFSFMDTFIIENNKIYVPVPEELFFPFTGDIEHLNSNYKNINIYIESINGIHLSRDLNLEVPITYINYFKQLRKDTEEEAFRTLKVLECGLEFEDRKTYMMLNLPQYFNRNQLKVLYFFSNLNIN